jgi:hypothetical protein
LSDNGKGISSFTSKGADWPANKTWILKAATALPSGLKAVNDHGNHYIIAPNEKMKLDGYISRLAKINTLNVPYTPPPQHVEFVVPKQSNHSSKSVLFLVNALLTVYHQKLGASDWDDNDYACIASIATSLESGELSLDELSCKEGAQDTKSQYMAAQAVGLYIGTDLKKAATLGEDETDANDHAVLYSALGLHSSTGHPLIDVLKVRDLYSRRYHTLLTWNIDGSELSLKVLDGVTHHDVLRNVISMSH